MPQARQRIVELIRCYEADSRNGQVCRELGVVRSLLAQIWLDAKPSQLEALVRNTTIGPIHRALVASNFGAHALTDTEESHRRTLDAIARQHDHQAWLQALLALMPYYPQEGIPLDNHGDRLPAWLRESLARDQPNSCSNPA
jgi:hypothetical protein